MKGRKILVAGIAMAMTMAMSGVTAFAGSCTRNTASYGGRSNVNTQDLYQWASNVKGSYSGGSCDSLKSVLKGSNFSFDGTGFDCFKYLWGNNGSSEDVTDEGTTPCTGAGCDEATCEEADCDKTTCDGSDCGDDTCGGSDCENDTCDGSDCDTNGQTPCTGQSCGNNGNTGNNGNNGNTGNNGNNGNTGNNGNAGNNGNTGNNGGNTDNDDDDTDQGDSTVSGYAAQVLSLVNKERTAAGLSALTMNTKATSAANVRAVEVSTYFSHTRPNGTSCFTALNEAGISNVAMGENIAKGQSSAAQVMNDWMNSEGHRANIMNSSYKQIGIGVYKDSSGRLSWVQMFIS